MLDRISEILEAKTQANDEKLINISSADENANAIRQTILNLNDENFDTSDLENHVIDDEAILSDEEAILIQNIAKNKLTELMVLDAINQKTFEQIEQLNEIVDAEDVDEVRDALNNPANNHFGGVDTTSENLLSNDAVLRVQNAARSKRNELSILNIILQKQYPEQAHLDGLVGSTNANAIRAELDNNANLGGIAIPNEQYLSDGTALHLRAVAVSKQNELSILKVIEQKQYANQAHLNNLANARNPNEIRTVLNGNNDIGNRITANENDLLNDAAFRIRNSAISKLNELHVLEAITQKNAATIAELNPLINATTHDEIRNVINFNPSLAGRRTTDPAHLSDDAAIRLQNAATGKRNHQLILDAIDSKTYADVNDLNALADAPIIENDSDGTADNIRNVLNKNALLGNLSTSNATELSNESALELKNSALVKRNILKIKQAIYGITDASDRALNNLADAETPDSIRENLSRNKINYGINGLPVVNISNLPDANAIRLKSYAVNRRNELIISNHINAKTFTEVDQLNILADANTEDDLRIALNNAALFGQRAINSTNDLNKPATRRIKNLAATKRNMLSIMEAINTTTDLNSIALNNLAHAGDANNIRSTIQGNRRDLGIGMLPPITNDNLPNPNAIQLKKAAISKLNELIILTAINNLTAANANHNDVKALLQIPKGDHQALRTALNGKAHLGGVDFGADLNNENLLSNAAADKIRETALDKVAALKGITPQQQERDIATDQWINALSEEEKKAKIENVRERMNAYEFRVKALESEIKVALHSKTRDLELPNLIKECEFLRKDLSLYHKTLLDDHNAAHPERNREYKNNFAKTEELLQNINKILATTSKQEHQLGTPVTKIANFSDHRTVCKKNAPLPNGITDFNELIKKQVGVYLGNEPAQLGVPGPINGLQAQPDMPTVEAFGDDTLVNCTKITTGLRGSTRQDTNVVSVQSVKDGTQVSELYFNPEELHRFGNDGYIKWAITEIENFRAASLNTTAEPIVFVGKLPSQLVKEMARYCAYKNYPYINKASNYIPSSYAVNDFGRNIQSKASYFFGGNLMHFSRGEKDKEIAKEETKFKPK